MAGPARLFLGITGGTCSGKSTLEAGLRQRLGDELSLISFDDMTIGRPVLEAAGVVVTDWDDPSLFRWDALRGHLADLCAGRPTTLDARARETRLAGVTQRFVPARPVVCLIGFLALYDQAIADLCAVRVFIDIPEPELVRRRLTREEAEHNREPYISGTLLPAHRRLVLPQRARATHVLDGMAARDELADAAAAIISQARRRPPP